MALLKENEIVQNIQHYPGWKYLNNKIEKEFQFKDFTETLDFVNKAGEQAEEMNHHPDIFVHSYNKVKFMITNHAEGGVTEKDFELADKIEKLQQ